MAKFNQLDPEILDAIKPFSGETPQTATPTDLIATGAALQQVKTSYTTAVAVQRPRSMARIVANVLEEATLAGSSFFYSWPVKNKKTGQVTKVEGASIDLAMCIARNYGNDAIEIEVHETPTHYIFKGIFVDLETGFTCPRLFRQRKGQDIGMADQDRAEDITFQIGQSKAIRNAILKAMPEWLEKQAIEIAKEAELKKIKPENIALSRAKILQFFTPWGVTQERIEAKLGRRLEEWTPQDIVELRGMATALKEGRISAQELFPTDTEESSSLKQQPATEKVAASSKQEDPVISSFIRLKETGWLSFLANLDPNVVDSWPPHVKEAFHEKCKKMNTPYNPAKATTKQEEQKVGKPTGGEITDPSAFGEDVPPIPSTTQEQQAAISPPQSPPRLAYALPQTRAVKGPYTDKYIEVANRIQDLQSIDKELYDEVCKDLNIRPITLEGISKVEEEFKKRLDKRLSE